MIYFIKSKPLSHFNNERLYELLSPLESLGVEEPSRSKLRWPLMRKFFIGREGIRGRKEELNPSIGEPFFFLYIIKPPKKRKRKQPVGVSSHRHLLWVHSHKQKIYTQWHVRQGYLDLYHCNFVKVVKHHHLYLLHYHFSSPKNCSWIIDNVVLVP